jgi:hypothetical protein
MKVFIDYIKTNKHWTFTIERGTGKMKVKANGASYPATKKGIKDMKRDCADIVAHMRGKDDIIVNRYQ